MTTNQLLLELKADCERLNEKDLKTMRILVRSMLDGYALGGRADDFQKDHDEYIEEMSLGGQKYKVPR